MSQVGEALSGGGGSPSAHTAPYLPPYHSTVTPEHRRPLRAPVCERHVAVTSRRANASADATARRAAGEARDLCTWRSDGVWHVQAPDTKQRKWGSPRGGRSAGDRVYVNA